MRSPFFSLLSHVISAPREMRTGLLEDLGEGNRGDYRGRNWKIEVCGQIKGEVRLTHNRGVD